MSKGIGLGISILNTACEQRILAKFVKWKHNIKINHLRN
jgi:hypothetical protein